MRLFILCLIALMPLSSVAQNEGIYIRVSDANVKKSLMALTPLVYMGSKVGLSKNQRYGNEIFNTIQNNLEVSSYFQFIKPSAYLENTSKVGLKPAPQYANGFAFKNWQAIGTEFLVRIGFQVLAGKIELETYVYHVPKANVVLAKKYTGTTSDTETLAHTFSNDLIFALTKKPGMFLSKVVISSDRAGGKWKEIFVMDWNGKNIKQVTRHKSIAISPNWSPDAKSITYTAFAMHKKTGTRNADLFYYELDTKKRYLLSAKKGINSGSTFAPNGNDIYLTISSKGTPDIYKINKEGSGLARITAGPAGAMNVEPDISPDGKNMVFSSDRSGRPMVYTMDLSSKKTVRRTRAGRYNASPVWSPDGKKIAFAGFDKTHFDVFIMNADGTGLKRMTSARKTNGKMANNENPTFSPDGRQIMFVSDRSLKNQIYIVNIDGTNERRITFDKHNYYQPKWSK